MPTFGLDLTNLSLVGGVLVLLATATVVVHMLRSRGRRRLRARRSSNACRRVRAWWLLCADGGRLLLRPTATVVFFGLISFWALREFITLTPTRPGDHRALFWIFFLCTPLQYVLVGWAVLSSTA